MSTAEQAHCMAALLQHCRLVDQLAMTGSVDHAELSYCLQQLFIFEHDDVEQAFGATVEMRPGFELLNAMLSREMDNHRQAVLQYAVALLHLERRVARQPDMLKVIRSRLEHAAYRQSHFASNPHSVTEHVAAIYQDTLSTLQYRIQVKGNMQHLQDDYTAQRVRALLMCALRAARLWRLAGGSRISMLMRRSHYARYASETLNKL